ncbi:MAG: DUF4062 domain-containing protein [Thalassolituus oleivorans]|uniref:DUF4062 domain-containing protein n=1 Tax=Thalassolituus oleivorans TaxID=187493 RepID=UPI001B59F806|nr:DUF4062 domain-containing protein [Thalassolituus oleivorans]MBQ0727549.1 DUF4062 domain-containing protein [Thalassolituus oleivorans]MBQ0779637.1 DUF4062 domain-containing protein [Thalassolituus oleivorans]
MAKPRIFVSSTYYDLKYIRSSLDNFIEALGFESVLSEKGDIAYSPDISLDESCYREASNADVFVLIVGGRYGSSASTEEKKPTRKFFDRYDSITKKEYDSAWSRDIPIYILVEQNVYSEYQTFLKNRANKEIQYAHVDSINIFHLIEEILAKPRNNPVKTFEKFGEIEDWLKEQWAGLFRELLQRMSSQKQISTLSSQVETLGAINSTLQRYLEVVISKVSPDDAVELIKSEHERLSEIELLDDLKSNAFFLGAFMSEHPTIEQFKEALTKATTFKEFANILGELMESEEVAELVLSYEDSNVPIADVNEAREILKLPPFLLPNEDKKLTKRSSGRAKSARR